jgi:DNA polymerase I-like protein with 3'-5' exonuclease and polymerase domains
MVCLSTANGEAKLYGREEGLDEAERIVREELSVGHNVFFDLGVLAADRPRSIPSIFKALDDGRIHCTKIRQMMIDNAVGQLKFELNEETLEWKKQDFSLAHLVRRHLGYDISAEKKGGDIWRLRYNELDRVPLDKWPEPARQYPLDDAIHTRDVWVSQEEKNVAPDCIPGFEHEMRAAWALDLLGIWGVRTDPVAVREYKAELEKEYAAQIVICKEFGFRRSNGEPSRDMKKVQKAVETWYREHGIEMKLTDKGAISTDREQLTDTDHPGLNAVAESVHSEKLLTTYVAALERGTQVPLNPSYNPIIETFRTSCSGGRKIMGAAPGLNLQNLPRKGKVRECIVPREGYVFAFCDYDTLEMRTLAQINLDWFDRSEMAESIREGRDLHVDFAADMLKIPYRSALERHEAGDQEIGDARQFCKISNYGMAGGMGPDTFVKYAKTMGGIIVGQEQAFELWCGFRKKWHEMSDYFERIARLCGEGKIEKQVFPRTGMVRGNVSYSAACNGNFQHLAARGAKDALYAVVKECYCDAGSPLFGCRPWLFAHDEIGMEIPVAAVGPKRAHEAAMRLQQIMIDVMRTWCPDVPISATVAMSRRWYKGAKPVFKSGLLVPTRRDGEKWVADAA